MARQRQRQTDLSKFEAWSSGHSEPHTGSPKRGEELEIGAKLSPGMQAATPAIWEANADEPRLVWTVDYENLCHHKKEEEGWERS